MTTVQLRHLAAFVGSLVAFVVAWIAIDLGYYSADPSGDSTVSWTLALVGADAPLAIFALGHATGGILWGLAFHCWWGMPRPSLWADYVARGQRITELETQLAALAARPRPGEA